MSKVRQCFAFIFGEGVRFGIRPSRNRVKGNGIRSSGAGSMVASACKNFRRCRSHQRHCKDEALRPREERSLSHHLPHFFRNLRNLSTELQYCIFLKISSAFEETTLLPDGNQVHEMCFEISKDLYSVCCPMVYSVF